MTARVIGLLLALLCRLLLTALSSLVTLTRAEDHVAPRPQPAHATPDNASEPLVVLHVIDRLQPDSDDEI